MGSCITTPARSCTNGVGTVASVGDGGSLPSPSLCSRDGGTRATTSSTHCTSGCTDGGTAARSHNSSR